MFTDRTALRSPELPTYEFKDKDGDGCCMHFFENGEGECTLFELQIYGEHGCMVLTKEQAIEFANKIIEHAR